MPQPPTQTDSNTPVLSKSSSSSITVLSKSSTDISFITEKLSAPDVAVSPGALLPTSSGSDIVAITDSDSELPDGLAFSVVELLKTLPPQCKHLSGIVYTGLPEDCGKSNALAMEIYHSHVLSHR